MSSSGLKWLPPHAAISTAGAADRQVPRIGSSMRGFVSARFGA
jgi:hypothetical protein